VALGLSISGVILAGGCVYFNTFYRARNHYDAGMEEVDRSDGTITRKAEEEFKKSIQKCAKIISRYENSSYVDDALLLMGKAFYQKTDYEESIKAFEKLLSKYPDSDKRAKALYWLAKAQFHHGLSTECLMTIDQLDENAIKSERADEISFLHGEVYFSMDKYELSYHEFGKLLDRKSSPEWRDQGLLRMAQCRFYLGDYDEALRRFQILVESTSSLSLKRTGYFWIASSFSEIGRYQEAMEAYKKLLEGELSDKEDVKARIGLGRQLVLLKREEEALGVFELITIDYPKLPEAAEASYLRGKVELETFQDGEKARQEFKKGFKQAPESEYGKKCREEWKEVERWMQLRDYVDAQEKNASADVQQALYLIAEFQLYQLKDLEMALQSFEALVDSFPESPWAPKASYARAWILEEEYGDTTSSAREYSSIVDSYPDTRYADYARLKLNMQLPERPAGFYEDEMDGELLSVAMVDESALTSVDATPVEAVSDTISEGISDSLPPEEPSDEDSLSGG